VPTASFEADGLKLEPGSDIADFHTISPDYFRAMNIPLLQGRPFTEAEGGQSPAAVIVNQTMARKLWPGEVPTTKRLRLTPESPWLPVVGVVADVKNHGPGAETKPEMYFPHAEVPFGLGPPRGAMILVVRAASDPRGLVGAIRGEIWSADKDLPVYEVQTMKQIVAASISQTRFTTALLSFFACLALTLAAVGVYGVTSYSVRQRTHELGIRMALGARRSDILRLIVGRGMLLTAFGVTCGLAASFALTRFITSLLFGVTVTDPLTFAAITTLLSAVALIACLIPARRAAKVDPMIALRYD
jgi:putative ABC transport system permease protein